MSWLATGHRAAARDTLAAGISYPAKAPLDTKVGPVTSPAKLGLVTSPKPLMSYCCISYDFA